MDSAVADTPTPSLYKTLRRPSNAANNSGLWFAIAAALALAGRRRWCRAALRGTLAIGATSALVNLLRSSPTGPGSGRTGPVRKLPGRA